MNMRYILSPGLIVPSITHCLAACTNQIELPTMQKAALNLTFQTASDNLHRTA